MAMHSHTEKTQENISRAVANDVQHNSSEAATYKKFPAVTSANPQAKQLRSPTSGVVQRLILLKSDEIDFGIIVNVYQMLRNGRDTRVAIETMMNTLSYTKKEPLHIMGHGSSEDKTLAGMSPKELAEMILLPKNFSEIDHIELLSCELGKGFDKSYAAELFLKAGGMKDIIAFTDFDNVNDKGESHNKPGSVQERLAYSAIINKYQVLVAQLQVKYSNAKIQTALDIRPGVTPEEVAGKVMLLGADIWNDSSALFTDLYAHNQKYMDDRGRLNFQAQ